MLLKLLSLAEVVRVVERARGRARRAAPTREDLLDDAHLLERSSGNFCLPRVAGAAAPHDTARRASSVGGSQWCSQQC